MTSSLDAARPGYGAPGSVLLTAAGVVAGRGQCRTAPLTLTLRAGQIAAVVGPSGTGKTSVLRALAGLDPIWSGGVESDVRRALCFQEPRLLPRRTVQRNVLFALGRRADAEDQHRVALLLQRLEIADLASRDVAELSGGQRRRVAIARTMATSAPVVLIDEPFNQLDRASAQLVETLLADHAAAGGAVVVAAHSASVVTTLADAAYPISS